MSSNMAVKIKNTNIRQIFETMDYGNDLENIDLAKEWFKKHEAIFAWIENKDESPNGSVVELKIENINETLKIFEPDAVTVDKILGNAANMKNKWCDVHAVERRSSINKLAADIQNNVKLFCQIEICARGILSRDTIKDVTLLSEYLAYYSSFAIRLEHEKSNWKPNGLCVAVITDENPLIILGLVLGPALAAGYNIILQTDLKYTLIANLLIELAIKNGIPNNVIRIIPGRNVDLQNIFTHENVSVVSTFGRISEEKFNVCNIHLLKLMMFSIGKIPMIVFNSADLDSACDSLIASAWSMSFSSVNVVLVQEDVLHNFVDKLKVKIDKLKVGASIHKTVDISESLFDQCLLEKLNKTLQDASLQGINVYTNRSGAKFKPSLLIGGNIFPNNVIKEDIDLPVVTILGFRTVNEAVLLANNNKLGYGASVWTQNVSLANETSAKLKVANVWINSNALQMPNISISPFKESGNFYLGGEEGFYEYMNVKKLSKNLPIINNKNFDKEKFVNAITAANKSQLIWSNETDLFRANCMKKFADNIAALHKATTDMSVQKWIDEWISAICIATTKLINKGYSASNILGRYNVVTYREPQGVIAIECPSDYKKHNKNLIVASLISGNSVLLLNNSKLVDGIYKELMKSGVPSGVINILSDYNNDTARTAALNKQLHVYVSNDFNEAFSSAPLKDVKKFKYIINDNNWSEILSVVTKSKNVWCDIKQSYA